MFKDKITLSINPTYLCNFRCSFCYLSDEQLSQNKIIDHKILLEKLTEVSSRKIIDHIDLYGGEIALINSFKLTQLIETINLFTQNKINIITNLSSINPVFLRDDIELSISWDYKAREKHERVFQNMQSLNKDFHVLILASDALIRLHDNELDEMIDMLNSLPFLKTVEIKPFSDNLFHPQRTRFSDYEAWIIKWIHRSTKFKFEFINIKKIQSSLLKAYSSWSDEHLYITPDGDFAVLEFNDFNQEYFLKLSDLDEYEQWAMREKEKIRNNPYCGNCEFLGSCLSEHLQPVKDLSQSCNGFRNLLKWYSIYPSDK